MHGLVGKAAEHGQVMLHFAYGANMHRPVMRKHAPDAEALGVASLADHRFVITADGYASIARAPGLNVHGLLWRITPRDRVTLDAWENVAGGLYRAATLSVRRDGQPSPALVYIARECPVGQPRAGYMEVVIEAARILELPTDYIALLQEWLPKDGQKDRQKNSAGAGRPKSGDFW
jgi:AIG2-like family